MWRKPKDPEKTTGLSQVTDKLITLIVMLGTDCIGRYKSNNHAITTMTVPYKSKEVSDICKYYISQALNSGKKVFLF